MYSYQTTDVIETLMSAKNLNAALKNFLKRELKPGDKGARFIKDLRQFVPFKLNPQTKEFFARSLPEYELHTLILVRYAFSTQLEQIVEQLFDRYADSFNTTYEKRSSGVEVLDANKFKEIVSKVLADIPELLKQQQLLNNGFIVNALLVLTFEQEVLKLISPIIKESIASCDQVSSELDELETNKKISKQDSRYEIST